jgi:hypothetical protein
VIHGLLHPPRAVLDSAGSALTCEYDAEHHSATVHLSGPSADWSAQLSL